jgi:hypothetical protein
MNVNFTSPCNTDPVIVKEDSPMLFSTTPSVRKQGSTGRYQWKTRKGYDPGSHFGICQQLFKQQLNEETVGLESVSDSSTFG